MPNGKTWYPNPTQYIEFMHNAIIQYIPNLWLKFQLKNFPNLYQINNRKLLISSFNNIQQKKKYIYIYIYIEYIKFKYYQHKIQQNSYEKMENLEEQNSTLKGAKVGTEKWYNNVQ